jgi:hypothetical protein
VKYPIKVCTLSNQRVQQRDHNKRQQVLLRTKLPPIGLLEHIRLANLIPPVPSSPVFSNLTDEVLDTLTSNPADADALHAGFLDVQVKFLHRHWSPEKFPELYKYLGPLDFNRETEINGMIRNLFGTRALLEAIAGEQINKRISSGREIEIPYNATPMSVALAVDGEGKLKVTRWPLLDALVGVEADRIRRCSECPCIFWAGRIDKFACCDKCVNRRNVRKWREHYLERYKLQRVRKMNAAEAATVNLHRKLRRKT